MRIIILISLILFGCATKSTKSSASNFQLRQYEEEVMPNGLKVLFIVDNSLPRISLALMLKVGSAQDPDGLEGLGHMTGWLLEDGTTHRSATKLADDFAFLGTELSISVARETTMINTSSLSSHRMPLLNLFADIVLSPAYLPSELNRKRLQTLSSLQKMVDNPQGFADFLLDQSVYGRHPYGRLVIGSEDSVKRISRSDLIKHYLKYYRPNNSMLAVVGNFDEDFRKEVRKAFKDWQSREVLSPPQIQLSEAQLPAIRLVSKQGLQQAQIRMGELGIQRAHPDFLKLRLANLILGGAFASRLNQKIRDDLGLTYSISSNFEPQKEGGSFEISTFSRNEKTADAITQTRMVIKDFVERGVTNKELAAAKALMIGQFPSNIETSDRLAYNLLALRFYGIDDSYLKDFITNVQAITLKEVNEAIKKHLRPDNLKTVVFADEASVASLLKSLGPVTVEKVANATSSSF